MPDIPDRDELERKLSRMIGTLNKAYLAKLLEYLGDPPSLDNVPNDFWDSAGRELAQTIIPFAESVYLEAAKRMLRETTIGVDWNLVNEAAANWAKRYAYNLSYAMVETRLDVLRKAIPRYFEEGWSQGRLRQHLERWYDPINAEMIARTEVTRAAVQGERALVEELRKTGIQMEEIWQTRVDEIVCEICRPRDKKRRGDGWDSDDEPPAHPRCRCWLNHRLVRVGR